MGVSSYFTGQRTDLATALLSAITAAFHTFEGENAGNLEESKGEEAVQEYGFLEVVRFCARDFSYDLMKRLSGTDGVLATVLTADAVLFAVKDYVQRFGVCMRLTLKLTQARSGRRLYVPVQLKAGCVMRSTHAQTDKYPQTLSTTGIILHLAPVTAFTSR
ncbi:hypothetical protein Bbelb_057780 [Branchiostoma belcheri]|nr:hypothetical protein Bbelb_057780 [Branchiostoma belcheri]